MSAENQDPVERTAASLVSGILGDLQHLVEQQLHLTRREIETELRERAAAAGVFALGVGVCFLGMFVLCLSLVHLLHWVALPPGTDLAWLPLWACHALVAAGLVTLGGVLGAVGHAQSKSIIPSQKAITEILQEPASWTTSLK